MCVVVVLLGVFRHIPVVVVHSRDEFLDRSASVPTVRDDGILAGIDGKAGGTWAGLNVHLGHAAVLTNCRTQDSRARPRSRGELVMRLLAGDVVPDERAEYGPFNVIYTNVSVFSTT